MRPLALLALLLLPSSALANCDYLLSRNDFQGFEECSRQEREQRDRQYFQQLDADRDHRARLAQQQQVDDLQRQLDELQARRR